jgi:DNA-binding winged helix-turn-helix (wHTH) protein
MSSTLREIRRFGPFELDLAAAEVRQQGRRVKLQPQPFKLLVLLTSRPGSLITREDIRSELWPEGTFVDFDQSVNFAVKQIRDAFGDSASQPIYLETVPRQGYRFVAPVETGPPAAVGAASAVPMGSNTVRLQKAMWANIAELRMAETRQRKMMRLTIAALAVVIALLAVYVVLRR